MNKLKNRGWLKHLDFTIWDMVYLELAFIVAVLLRHHGLYVYGESQQYIVLTVMILVIDILYVLLRKPYSSILKRSVYREGQSVLLQNITVWVVVMAYLYMTGQIELFSRIVFAISAILSVIIMLIGRVIWKSIIRKRLVKGRNLPYILVIATENRAKNMLERFRSLQYNGFNLKGFVVVDKDMEGKDIEKVPVVCNKDNLLDYVLAEVVDEVMINLPGDDPEVGTLIKDLLRMGVVVHLAIDYVSEELPNRYVERIGGYTFLTTSVNMSEGRVLFGKRLIDILAGLVGCVIMLIALIFVGPAIKVLDPGPVFYGQERVGTNGRRFQIYKFRSMYQDADKRKAELQSQNKMQGQMFKIDNDPRIIGSEKGEGKGFGNFIRKWSIDELPQFINILRGDMSLVGTRPPTVDEFEAYDQHHKIRLSMKPGLTGMWQVNGRSQITDFEKIVELDAYYIENWSMKLDIKIILKTFLVVFARMGAE